MRRKLTLAGCTLLHAFTHAYGAVLVPLYILIARDLGLGGVGWVTLIVAVYGLVYCWGSYLSGVLADRVDRRWLLAVGLTASLFGQGMLNIGVTSGLLPQTGVGLPFITSGGTSLIISLVTVGLLLNLSRESGPTEELGETDSYLVGSNGLR